MTASLRTRARATGVVCICGRRVTGASSAAKKLQYNAKATSVVHCSDLRGAVPSVFISVRSGFDLFSSPPLSCRPNLSPTQCENAFVVLVSRNALAGVLGGWTDTDMLLAKRLVSTSTAGLFGGLGQRSCCMLLQ